MKLDFLDFIVIILFLLGMALAAGIIYVGVSVAS